jgi:LysM repeat protein
MKGDKKMPSSLELANKIYDVERQLQSLYGQLENSVIRQPYLRTVQNLRYLQARQLSILNSLIESLEQEQPPVPPQRYYAQHVLQYGETIRVLAQEYNTNVSEIRRYNPGLPIVPQPGTLITLPIEIPQPPTESARYYVQRGDTLFQIAQRFNTDVETLVVLNNIADPDLIFPGRILIIPA